MVYEKTDDSYDVLYNADKRENIRIDKGEILSMYYDRVKNPYDNKWYSYLVIKVRDDDCAKAIFEFAAKHSGVVWSRSSVFYVISSLFVAFGCVRLCCSA